MTKTKYLIVFLIIAASLLSGCATQNRHIVNSEALKLNMQRAFKIGAVKVVVAKNLTPFGNEIDRKIDALNVIPIEAICNTLESTYGIRIDSTTDNTVRIISKLDESKTTYYGTPYYGNVLYTEHSFLKSLFGLCPSIIKNKSPKDVVNITYGLREPSFKMKLTYWYSVNVRSDDQEIISHSGIIANTPSPKKYLFLDLEAVLNELVINAKKIHTILIKDITK
jgi:hypothetical protein